LDTTMNVLHFPIQLRAEKNQFMRTEGLKEREENQPVLDEVTNTIENETTIVGRYFSFNKQDMKAEILENIESTSGVEYTYSSDENAFNEDRSFESSEHNYINYRQEKMRAFNPDSYKKRKMAL
ncbi:unnamed protein product, partial [Rotaria sp. Silwood2]